MRPSATQIVALASFLLVIGATFFIADGVQTIAAGALARAERYPRAAAVLGDQLLADRLHQRLCARIPARARRQRRLDRLYDRARCSMRRLLVWRFHALTARGYMPEVPKAETDFSRTKPLPAE